MPRVLCAGHVNRDVTLRVDVLPEPDGEARVVDRHRSGGGSAANAAVTLAGLAVESGLVGSVGDDDLGARLREELADRGVAVAGLETVPEAETTVKYLVVDARGEVMVLGNDGANEAVGPGDLSAALLDGVDHVHLTSQRPDTAATLAELAHDAGAGVSFDPGRRLADRDFAETLGAADLLFLNGREHDAVARAYPEAVHDTVVVEKRGREGAEVRWDGRSVSHDGFDVEAVNSTGAGDAFAAGFIAARLDGADHAAALAYANACGALVTAAMGAWVAPSAEEVAALLDAGDRAKPGERAG